MKVLVLKYKLPIFLTNDNINISLKRENNRFDEKNEKN